ncbi:hypothetical protein [Streptomyces goshikiensis]|uniref:hypothetical protein n=1 Tax=Streptomyces goshikiensis TaxID=1942 RepID=UPI003680AE3F
MTKLHARALKTHDINEVFVDELKQREGGLRARHAWLVPALDQLSSGRAITPPRAPAGVSLAEHADLIDIASHVGIYRMWARRGRVTFDLNEHMAAELYRSAYTTLPGNIFDRLPYINPLCVLPDPWPGRYRNTDALVRGFFIHGYNQLPERQTYTDEPDIEGLGLLFVVDLLDQDTGEVRSQTHVRLNIPTGLHQFTLKQAVDFAAARAEAVWSREPTEKPVYQLFEELLKPALSILVYLCCDNRDVVEPPVAAPTRKSRRNRVRQERHPFFVEVGLRIGPRLHAARRAAGRVRDGDHTPSGVERAPHQRAGHSHRYWTGPKRKREVTLFVAPHWVNFHLLDGIDPITMVVPVEPQRRDPLRRRGLRGRAGSSAPTTS